MSSNEQPGPTIDGVEFVPRHDHYHHFDEKAQRISLNDWWNDYIKRMEDEQMNELKQRMREMMEAQEEVNALSQKLNSANSRLHDATDAKERALRDITKELRKSIKGDREQDLRKDLVDAFDALGAQPSTSVRIADDQQAGCSSRPKPHEATIILSLASYRLHSGLDVSEERTRRDIEFLQSMIEKARAAL